MTVMNKFLSTLDPRPELFSYGCEKLNRSTPKGNKYDLIDPEKIQG